MVSPQGVAASGPGLQQWGCLAAEPGEPGCPRRGNQMGQGHLQHSHPLTSFFWGGARILVAQEGITVQQPVFGYRNCQSLPFLALIKIPEMG